MHVSPARQELYAAIERFEQQRKDETMSRTLPSKHGYHAGETEELEAVGFTVQQVGYLKEVAVTYKTGHGQQVTLRAEVVPRYVRMNGGLVDIASLEKAQEMLARSSITYPD